MLSRSHTSHPQILHLACRNDLGSVARPRVSDLRFDPAPELRVEDAHEDIDDPDHERGARVQDPRPGLHVGFAETHGEEEAEAALDGACDEKAAAEPEVDVG